MGIACLPNYTLVLLLSNIGRHFAVDLGAAQGHSESLRHVVLDGWRNFFILVGGADPDLRRALVLKFASPQLDNLSI